MSFVPVDRTQFLADVGWANAAAAAQGAAVASGAHVLAWRVQGNLDVLFVGKPSSAQVSSIEKSLASLDATGDDLRLEDSGSFQVVSGVTATSGFTSAGDSGTVEIVSAAHLVKLAKFSQVITSALAARGIVRTIVLTEAHGDAQQLYVIALGSPSKADVQFLQSAMATDASVSQGSVPFGAFEAF